MVAQTQQWEWVSDSRIYFLCKFVAPVNVGVILTDVVWYKEYKLVRDELRQSRRYSPVKENR